MTFFGLEISLGHYLPIKCVVLPRYEYVSKTDHLRCWHYFQSKLDGPDLKLVDTH